MELKMGAAIGGGGYVEERGVEGAVVSMQAEVAVAEVIHGEVTHYSIEGSSDVEVISERLICDVNVSGFANWGGDTRFDLLTGIGIGKLSTQQILWKRTNLEGRTWKRATLQAGPAFRLTQSEDKGVGFFITATGYHRDMPLMVPFPTFLKAVVVSYPEAEEYVMSLLAGVEFGL